MSLMMPSRAWSGRHSLGEIVLLLFAGQIGFERQVPGRPITAFVGSDLVAHVGEVRLGPGRRCCSR